MGVWGCAGSSSVSTLALVYLNLRYLPYLFSCNAQCAKVPCEVRAAHLPVCGSALLCECVSERFQCLIIGHERPRARGGRGGLGPLRFQRRAFLAGCYIAVKTAELLQQQTLQAQGGETANLCLINNSSFLSPQDLFPVVFFFFFLCPNFWLKGNKAHLLSRTPPVSPPTPLLSDSPPPLLLVLFSSRYVGAASRKAHTLPLKWWRPVCVRPVVFVLQLCVMVLFFLST